MNVRIGRVTVLAMAALKEDVTIVGVIYGYAHSRRHLMGHAQGKGSPLKEYLTLPQFVRITNQFKKKRVLVIGDVMLDQYYWGNVSRISPEAPVPVVRHTHTTYALGGAGNVAMNLRALGATVTIMGVVGNDDHQSKLFDLLTSNRIIVRGMVMDSDRPTTVKKRVMAHSQQLVRLDFECSEPLSPSLEVKTLYALNGLMRHTDAIIVSDYGKGFLTSAVLNYLRGYVENIPIIVDPKSKDFEKYRGFNTLTPNCQEALNAYAFARSLEAGEVARLEVPAVLEEIASHFITKYDIQALLITRGEHGMFLGARPWGNAVTTHFYSVPSFAKEVYDVTGAGDTAIAAFTLCLASGATHIQAAVISNATSALAVGKLGTTSITLNELRSSMLWDKEKKGKKE